MKNLKTFLSLSLIAIAFVLSSCDKEICTECTESNTGVSDSFCGTDSEVDAFEDTLNELGSSLGQDWNCVR